MGYIEYKFNANPGDVKSAGGFYCRINQKALNKPLELFLLNL